MKLLIALSTFLLAANVQAVEPSKPLTSCESGKTKAWISFLYVPKKHPSPAYAGTTVCGPQGFTESEAGLQDAVESIKAKYQTSDVVLMMVRKLEK